MDDDINELMVSLCTRAGMIMEDVSMIAVTMPRTWISEADAALDRLAAATAIVAQLVAARSGWLLGIRLEHSNNEAGAG